MGVGDGGGGWERESAPCTIRIRAEGTRGDRWWGVRCGSHPVGSN